LGSRPGAQDRPMLHHRLTRTASALLLLLAVGLLASACGGDSGSSSKDSKSSKAASSSSSDDTSGGGGDSSSDDVASRADKYDTAPTDKLDPGKTYVVHVRTTAGDFDIKLDQKAGPIAAANFAFLVKDHFYDGIIFHRVIKDFMVQTGDPTGTGTGGPGYAIKDDKVTGSYSRGTVAMANAGPDTGGSQFFIVQGTTVDQQLGKDYSIFGHVDAAGMKVIDKIASAETTTGDDGAQSKPVKPVKIISATISS
jgi:cyclophilin family peptidyl-prolyl cis-trans isomerase